MNRKSFIYIGPSQTESFTKCLFVDKEATAVPIAVPIFGLATVFVIGLLIGVVVFKQRDESQIVPMQGKNEDCHPG